MDKILLADGQSIFCEGVRCILQNSEDFKIVDVAINLKELYQKLESSHPDILLIDFDTVADFKIDEFNKIRTQYPEIKICVISANKNKDIVYKVLKCGIINYISKDCDADEFHNALFATANKEKYFSRFVVEILFNKKVWNHDDDNHNHITNKEIEIIKLLAQGLTTKDIAEKIFISHHTVNTHRKNILGKLHLKNTSELVMYAIKSGIVDTIEYYI